METGDMMQAAEAIGRQAAEMRDAMGAVDVPPRGQPMAGVASSAAARCRQIAAEMVAISGEMLTQLRMFEHSVTRGRRIARVRQMAQAAGKNPDRPTTSGSEPEPEPEEDDRWDEWDDL